MARRAVAAQLPTVVEAIDTLPIAFQAQRGVLCHDAQLHGGMHDRIADLRAQAAAMDWDIVRRASTCSSAS